MNTLYVLVCVCVGGGGVPRGQAQGKSCGFTSRKDHESYAGVVEMMFLMWGMRLISQGNITNKY